MPSNMFVLGHGLKKLFFSSVYAAETRRALEVDHVRRGPVRDGDDPSCLWMSYPRRKSRQRQIRGQTLASHHFWTSHVHSG